MGAWEAIAKDGRWADYAWTVRIDPDTVFLPDRLKLKLSGQAITEKGIYFTNCEHVKFGFFGNLEVVSKAAFSNLLDGLDECRADPDVEKKVTTPNCKMGTPAFHPLKEPADYIDCLAM